MAIDPVTGGLIMGGANLLGGLFGGESDEVKLARRQQEFQERAYGDRRGDQAAATDFAGAQFKAKNALMQQLMQRLGGLQENRVDLSGMFRSNFNPWSQGQTGSAVSSNITPIQFSPEALGANITPPSITPSAQPRMSDQLRSPGGGFDDLMQRVRSQLQARGM